MYPLWLNTQTESGTRDFPVPWSWHYHQLQSLRDHILVASNGHPDKPPTLLGASPQYPEDQSIDDLTLKLLASEPFALAEVDAAIERIRTGRYGICEQSGQPIPRERLITVPWARYTCPVQDRIDRAGGVPAGRAPDQAKQTHPLKR